MACRFLATCQPFFQSMNLEEEFETIWGDLYCRSEHNHMLCERRMMLERAAQPARIPSEQSSGPRQVVGSP